MSQDLFAAFSNSPPKHEKTAIQQANFSTTTNNSLVDDWSTAYPTTTADGPAAQSSALDDDGNDDDFGDFEDASATVESKPAPSSARAAEPAPPSQASTQSTMKPEIEPKAKPTKKPLPFKPPEPKGRHTTPESKVASRQKEVGSHPFAGHMDILFAADEDEYDAGDDDFATRDLSSDPQAAMEWSKRVIAEQQRQSEKAAPFDSKASQPAKSEPNKLRKKSGYVPPKDPNVLFDAEDLSEPEVENEDDFGDFETVAPTLGKATTQCTASKQSTHTVPLTAMDLLSLDDSPPEPPIGRSNGHATSSSKPASKPAPQPRPNFADEDDGAWDDFEDGAADKPSNDLVAQFFSADPTALSITTIAAALSSKTPDSVPSLPPTNVPPPSLLMSLFPPLFSATQTHLFAPLTALPASQKSALLASPLAHSFLRGYLAAATVLAHIIAGRKLRWKRDQILAQSMRIGAATAGGKGGGMKLTGLDKTEVAKEDREVVDTVALWKAQLGRLRSIVSSVNSSSGGKSATSSSSLPPVPEISDSAMPISTLSASRGGITAPHACAMCGLRREERMARVDVEVDDSFGEWWVEGGVNMHLLCLRFWEARKQDLRSR